MVNGNQIDLTIRDESKRKIGYFRFNQSEFPNICKILKAKYGIRYKPEIPFDKRVNSINHKVVTKEDNFLYPYPKQKSRNKWFNDFIDKPDKNKEESNNAGWLGNTKTNKDSKSPNWLDM